MASAKFSFTAGSTYLFVLIANQDGRIWDLTSATVQLLLRDPAGNIATLSATVTDATNGIAQYSSSTTDIDEPNDGQKSWALRWKITDGSVVQNSHWIDMPVPD